MMKSRIILYVAVALVAVTNVAAQKFEDLAQTPPLGWNSWNHFGCDVSEELIRETADAMVASGMKDAGYLYVNIDDCWHGERDENGFIQPDAERFPSGMKALADYVHSKGLKLGIYSDAGWKTCAGRPGSRGFEYQDALTYARWDIDYLKYDWCNRETHFKARLYRVRDLWSGEDLGSTRQTLEAEVPGHDVLMVRLTRQLTPAAD
jgi:alpha-galactosidase